MLSILFLQCGFFCCCSFFSRFLLGLFFGCSLSVGLIKKRRRRQQQQTAKETARGSKARRSFAVFCISASSTFLSAYCLSPPPPHILTIFFFLFYSSTFLFYDLYCLWALYVRLRSMTKKPGQNSAYRYGSAAALPSSLPPFQLFPILAISPRFAINRGAPENYPRNPRFSAR